MNGSRRAMRSSLDCDDCCPLALCGRPSVVLLLEGRLLFAVGGGDDAFLGGSLY